MLREIKPRNARTARIVKAREPQLLEDRKKTLFLHGTKCPLPVSTVLKTFHALTKPYSVLLNKKNENIHPFEDVSSLEFLATKNECGLVVFGAHSKKRPNNVTVLRTYDGRLLDMVELLLITKPGEVIEQPKLEIAVGMKPLILFAGPQWDDASSSEQSSIYSTLKSLFLDVFSGEEITSIDVQGLQYILMIATGEPSHSQNQTPDSPVIHLRWYKLRTLRSNTPKIPRVELDPIGPAFDFRIGRSRLAEPSLMKDALKRARPPGEARTKKNIEMDIVGDKVGRVHLGRQDIGTLQTRKMKGLKRGREIESDEEGGEDLELNGEVDEDGMDIDEVSVSNEEGEEDIEFIDEDGFDEDDDGEDNEFPKRQRLA